MGRAASSTFSFSQVANGVSFDSAKSLMSAAGMSIPSFSNFGSAGNVFDTELPSMGSFGTGGSEGAGGQGSQEMFVTLRSLIKSDEKVILNVTPTIGEERSATYDGVQMAHHPGEMLRWRSTSARTWNLGNVKLVSRTPEEASKNQAKLNVLRSWLMPYYGNGTKGSSTEAQLGAPPPIIEFSAYGKKSIDKHPVVVLSVSTSWPDDVTYIPTTEGEQFPVIMTVTISLKESFSPAEFSGFDLAAYKRGDLQAAYPAKSSASPPSTNVAGEASDTSQPTGNVYDTEAPAEGQSTGNVYDTEAPASEPTTVGNVYDTEAPAPQSNAVGNVNDTEYFGGPADTSGSNMHFPVMT